MKHTNNHKVHLVLTMLMLLISGVIVQLPSYKKRAVAQESAAHNSELVQRIQSLVYTGDVSVIAQGLSRYFIGSLDEALTEFLAMEHMPLSARDKELVLLSMMQKLRHRPEDQQLVCKQLMAYHRHVASEPLLYSAAKSAVPDTIKDIIRCTTAFQPGGIDQLVYSACDYALNHDDLLLLETLYLQGAAPTQPQASQLLKRVVCENKSTDLAQFFIERAHADLYYTDENNRPLIAHAMALNKKGVLSTLMREGSKARVS